MRNGPQRLPCPACLGVALETVHITNGARVDHCRRCGGTWLMRGQIARLRALSTKALTVMIRRADDAGFLCHGCHAPMHRDAAKCEACGWKNSLDCPDCGKPMRRRTERNVAVDVCRACEAVWLDHHELSAIWAGAAAVAMTQASGGSNLSLVPDGGDLLDIFVHAPDLAMGAVRGVAHVAEAGVEAAAHAPGLLSSLPEVAGGALEIVGDLAGAVFEIIVTIIGGIFEGFSL